MLLSIHANFMDFSFELCGEFYQLPSVEVNYYDVVNSEVFANYRTFKC
jgi:hypothetical protein